MDSLIRFRGGQDGLADPETTGAVGQIRLPSHPGGAFGQITRSVRHQLKPLAQAHPGALLAVACSGGADSLALAAAVASVAPGLALRSVALHVDHGWRSESAAEARQVMQLLVRLGYREPQVLREAPRAGKPEPAGALSDTAVAGHTDVADDAGSEHNLEARGRELRYRLLRGWATAHGSLGHEVFLLLGHTLDDQAESVLLGLARGSGMRAISGMRARQGGFLRPLLETRRRHTQQACEQLGLPYLTDPSNLPNSTIRAADGAPLRRCAIRYQALPALREALRVDPKPALARTAIQMQEDQDALDGWARSCYEQAQRREKEDGPTRHQCDQSGRNLPGVLLNLNCQSLYELPVAVRRRIWRMAALDAGVRAGDLRMSQLVQLDRMMVERRGTGPLDLPGEIQAWRVGGTWQLIFTPART